MTVSGPSARASLVSAPCAHVAGSMGPAPSTASLSCRPPAKPPVYGACRLLDLELEMVSRASVSMWVSQRSRTPREGHPGSFPCLRVRELAKG